MDKTTQSEIFTSLFPAINILSDEEIENLKSNFQVLKLSKKDILFQEGGSNNHLYLLKSGLIKLSKDLKNKRSIILKISTPGDLIGLMSQFGDNKFEYSAAAIVESEVYYIDIKLFKSIIENNGKYAIVLMNILCAENTAIFNRIVIQNHKQLPGKLADILLYFSEKIYSSDSFVLPLTRSELAELAGTTKESFIRTLTEFKNDKIIEIDNKSIKIISFEILKTLSRIG